jgi:hypothetical protein
MSYYNITGGQKYRNNAELYRHTLALYLVESVIMRTGTGSVMFYLSELECLAGIER